jgi:hypothetical protein
MVLLDDPNRNGAQVDGRSSILVMVATALSRARLRQVACPSGLLLFPSHLGLQFTMAGSVLARDMGVLRWPAPILASEPIDS